MLVTLNAEYYNEEGSQIFIDAGVLKVSASLMPIEATSSKSHLSLGSNEIGSKTLFFLHREVLRFPLQRRRKQLSNPKLHNLSCHPPFIHQSCHHVLHQLRHETQPLLQFTMEQSHLFLYNLRPPSQLLRARHLQMSKAMAQVLQNRLVNERQEWRRAMPL